MDDLTDEARAFQAAHTALVAWSEAALIAFRPVFVELSRTITRTYHIMVRAGLIAPRPQPPRRYQKARRIARAVARVRQP